MLVMGDRYWEGQEENFDLKTEFYKYFSCFSLKISDQ